MISLCRTKIFLFHPEHNSVVILDPPPSPPGKVWQGRHDLEFRNVGASLRYYYRMEHRQTKKASLIVL